MSELMTMATSVETSHDQAAALPAPIIVVERAGELRIHTFVAAYTDNNIANATHIIESAHALVLVDGQFLAPYAKQFRAYADGLGKPIHRLYLSHRHPDHWLGLGAAFADIPIFALEETISFLIEHGEESLQDHLTRLGSLAPDRIVIPKYVVGPGEQLIDGVRYVFRKIVDTEIDFLLTIQLPDVGVYIIQDLLYSGTHLYLTQDKNLEHWIHILEGMLASDHRLFFPGHGLPVGKKEVAQNVEYLAAARRALANGLRDDAFKAFLTQRYPGRLCPGIFDVYLPRLFDGARDY